MTDSTARLLGATRRRLTVVTLGLIVLLVVGIGTATALVGLRALDADVDHALATSVDSAVAALGGELPQGDNQNDGDETVPAAADTFILYLDPAGAVVANPSRVALAGIPDAAAVSAARSSGSDLRTVEAGGVDVRLQTDRVEAESGGALLGFVQGGFVLTLHDQQSRSLVEAIALVGVIGLLGAAAVTLLVTGDALGPIRRSFAAQRRFVADASHELRTPAALIRANAEVIEREGLVTSEGRPFVADIVTEADRLGRLVGDLLQLAATDASGLVLDRGPIDLAIVAADTVRQAQALADEHGVDLRLEPAAPDGGSTVVSGDGDRLTQLVLILVDNALDHAPPETIVRVAVRHVDRTVELAVSDQGPGIPAGDRARVFEPFTRLPGVERDRADGTGLGLAIASRIAIAHDGTLAVDDAPGGGARFRFSLPVAPRS